MQETGEHAAAMTVARLFAGEHQGDSTRSRRSEQRGSPAGFLDVALVVGAAP